jgi:hypothetical protein
LKIDVNVPSESNKQKNVEKIIFCLQVTDEIAGSGSAPTFHGYATLPRSLCPTFCRVFNFFSFFAERGKFCGKRPPPGQEQYS